MCRNAGNTASCLNRMRFLALRRLRVYTRLFLPDPFDGSSFDAGLPIDTMVEWSLPLQSVFPAAVTEICTSPNASLGHLFLYYRLSKSEIPALHPAPAAKLVLVRGPVDLFAMRFHTEF
jgi:hypothetical protein